MEEYKKKTNTGDDVFIRIQKSPTAASPPTVVLFGWLGAAHRNLDKYSALFSAMSYNTVQLIPPVSVVFAMKQRKTATFLLSVLRILAADLRLSNGGLIFVLFSNGGAVCAPHLSNMFAGLYPDLIKADDEPVVTLVKNAIAAIIFDSSPCYMHVSLGAQAINEGMKVPSGILSAIVVAVFTFLCFFQRLFFCNLPLVFWEGLKNADYLCPEQYIYSSDDHLLDTPALDALIQHRKNNGKNVHVFKVNHADHVLILRHYPDKYLEVIRAVNERGVNPWRLRNSIKPYPTTSFSQDPPR